MKATDPRYHVGLGLIYDKEGRFSFDRTASFADLWAILFHNVIRHPFRVILRARRYTVGVRTPW